MSASCSRTPPAPQARGIAVFSSHPVLGAAERIAEISRVPGGPRIATVSFMTLRRALRSLLSDRRGAASTEYVALLGTVAIAAAAAIAGWGPHLVVAYDHTRTILISPTP